MPIQKISQKGNISIVILLIIIVLAGVLVLLVVLKNNNKVTPQVPQNVKTQIDTTNWVLFPDKGSYLGWTIRHPKENEPMLIQNGPRIYLNGEDGVMIEFLNGKTDSEQMKSFATEYMNNDFCAKGSTLSEITLNGYMGYKYTGICNTESPTGPKTEGKTVWILISTTNLNNHLVIKEYDGADARTQDKELAKKIIETVTFISAPTQDDDTVNTFRNINPGFSVRYPLNFKQVTGEDNAWPNAALILYSGGQSYDLVVQVWNTEAEYKKEYGENPAVLSNLVVKKVGGKVVTFLNQNKTKEVDEIISSYQIVN